MSEPDERSALERLRRLEAAEARRPRAGLDPSDGVPTPPDPASPPERGEPRRDRGRLGAFLAGVGVLALKGKALLALLKLEALLATVASMGLSFWFYARTYGASFALGLVVLILVHELGHGASARLLGLRVGPPIFIPGFGAFIALKDQPRSTWVSAIVGYGGPMAGTLGGVFVGTVGPLFLAAPLAQALAHFTFLINLFNLLPVGGLDGDRISEPLEARHWAVGLALSAAIAAYAALAMTRQGGVAPHVAFAVGIVILGGVKAFRVHRRRRRSSRSDGGRLVDRLTGPDAAYVDETSVTPARRLAAATAYFALIGLLMALSAVSVPPSAP